MRPDVSRGKVIVALKRAIEATFDKAKWIELGYLLGREEIITDHPRLLRSLHWHGRVNARELEIAHARLAVNGAVAAATFLLEVWQAQGNRP